MWLYAISWQSMSQKCKRFCNEDTFALVELQLTGSNSCEYISKPMVMLLFSGSPYNNIILRVSTSWYISYDWSNLYLIYLTGRVYPKWEAFETITSKWSSKGQQVCPLIINFYLPVSRSSIEFRESEMISSVVGRRWCCLLIALLRGLGSKQILSFPFGLETITNALTHSVGFSTGSITFRSTIRWSSSLSFGFKALMANMVSGVDWHQLSGTWLPYST